EFKIFIPYAIITALFHDIMEDKTYILKWHDIQRYFGKKVYKGVRIVTKERGKQYYFGLENCDWWILLVKFADRIHNLRTLTNTDEEFAAKAVELSLESNTKTDSGSIGFKPAGTITSLYGSEILEKYIFSTEGYDYALVQDADVSKQRAYWLIEVLERKTDSEQIHTLGMLLPSEQVALEVKARLAAGESWGDLAVEFSQLANVEENQGDMDWITFSSVPENVADIIFATDVELNTVLDPIQDDTNYTRGGCWIVRLKSIDENRQLSEDDRKLLISDKLDQWTADLKAANLNKLTNTFSDELITFAITQLDK
ncbi:MAG: peptidylprolyl isomerase, partial [Dehalococcoides mccartyi]